MKYCKNFEYRLYMVHKIPNITMAVKGKKV